MIVHFFLSIFVMLPYCFVIFFKFRNRAVDGYGRGVLFFLLTCWLGERGWRQNILQQERMKAWGRGGV